MRSSVISDRRGEVVVVGLPMTAPMTSLLTQNFMNDHISSLAADALMPTRPPVPNWWRWDFHFGKRRTSKEPSFIPPFLRPAAQKAPAGVMPTLPPWKLACWAAPPPVAGSIALFSLVMSTSICSASTFLGSFAFDAFQRQPPPRPFAFGSFA